MSERKQIATKEDWETEPMPEKNEKFIFKRRFKKEEIENLKKGHMPDEMEDRWFAYYEDNKLYIHRSWSGLCIYIVEFDNFLGRNKVIVNRDENQYANTDIQEDKETLNCLLNCWS